MINRLSLRTAIAAFAISANLCAQPCPENVGFENGNFQNWKLYTGITTAVNHINSIETHRVSRPANSRHAMISDKRLIDPYGKFKVIPPTAGNFVVKLGNDGTGNQADGISYLITVPENRPEFTLTYQYAVVLEEPNHLPSEQPRFVARVKDVEKNEYIGCVSFEYISTSSLPGFQKCKPKESIIYKDWTPVTMNLSGYQGKKLELEFISADCTLGGHFGYAYVDVGNLCGDMVIGNNLCESADHLSVSGPRGFQTYNWYNENRSIQYGSGQSIDIKPAPADGSKIVLDLIPYDGFGCPSTISSVVRRINYQLQVLEKKTVCKNSAIDFASDEFILNKSDDFSYLVFEDKDLTRQVKGKAIVTKNSTYHIVATNYEGCESFATIDVSVDDISKMTAHNPPAVCYGETVDITAEALYKGSLEGIERSYFTDANAKKKLRDPVHISVAGIYYVKLTNAFGCSNMVPIEVSVVPKPVLKITNPAAACYPGTVDITAANIFTGSDDDLRLSFFEDQFLTIAVTNPQEIAKAGSYYVSAINTNGCVVSHEIEVVINDLPVLVVKNPEKVCYPETVNLTASQLFSGSAADLEYSFFNDELLTDKVVRPEAVSKSGTYFVKATNASGCFVSGQVEVTIYGLPKIVVNVPKPILSNAFADLTAAEILAGSENYSTVAYFEDRNLKRPLQNPKSVGKAGQYYISITNNNGCSASAAVQISVLPEPKIVVPTAFTPQKQNNNRLYPFLVSMKKLNSFKIFNKWGILVYHTTDMHAEGWDGQFKSKMQPLETFSWFAEGIDVFGQKYQTSGKTILIL
ncbi:gliding motility-associated C-terminal domain-containing protein [Pedobacter endophyticus]|uniref:Gliding motility-associated C-terminal domain-containing protein n=1 Tax=Pedobacter endophyticus TaxID=2789740 RepID=A0A7S9L180_9SPHI|nr:gliding motility-associated C-terminal domain-containing protein [Pedobacter endophyticus]QPH40271.1 gliding motility-associated C-terminal domain-containing protein [Pedobacter endophyticus]